jgi:hypothetical protein
MTSSSPSALVFTRNEDDAGVSVLRREGNVQIMVIK